MPHRPCHWIGIFLLATLPPTAKAQESSFEAKLKERFAQYDRNNDEVLTRDEIDPAAPFDQLDTDQNQRITLQEARTFLERLGKQAVRKTQAESTDELTRRFQHTAPPLPPLRQRIENRTFPSVFMAWSPATNLKGEDPAKTMARHDLIFLGAERLGLRWNRRPSGLATQFNARSIPPARAMRAQLQSLNANLILLTEIRYRDAHPSFLPAEHPWWKRDADGNRVAGWEEGGFFLLDFSNPAYRAHVAQRAKAAIATGAFDGIMLDWWTDDKDRVELAREIRQAIGEDAILLVNANDRQTPATAAYVNGYFMECWRSKTREDWDRIAKTLRYAATELREPRVNCVETWFAHSRRDENRMRATTCLALTHSNGYCLFSDPNPLPTADHLHDWYPFWKRQLGQPTAPCEIQPDGSARRDFTHGTAVYNPPENKSLTVTFAEPRRSLATGKTATHHRVPALDGDIFISDPMIRQGLVACRLREMGAHVVEGFEQDSIDQKKWRIWHSNPDRVSFAIEQGRFTIQGRGPIGHNGLWQIQSRRFKDVALVARFDIVSSSPGSHDLCLHLCGGDMPLSPDHWAEITMRDMGDDQVLFRPVVATELEGFQQSQKQLALARGKEPGFLGRVALNGSSNRCSMEIRDADGKWHAVIDPTPLLLRSTHCEIKMRGEGLADDSPKGTSRGWFDDVRIYPRAASHPILVRLVDGKGEHIYRRDGETWPPVIQVKGHEPSPLADLVVELWNADGSQRIARSQANNFGYYMLPVVHEQWDVFPVAAKVRLSYKDQPLGEVDIPCKQLQGLYPDDVYDLIVE